MTKSDLEQELAFAKAAVYDLRFSKGWREEKLRVVRRLEKALGIEGENTTK